MLVKIISIYLGINSSNKNGVLPDNNSCICALGRIVMHTKHVLCSPLFLLCPISNFKIHLF